MRPKGYNYLKILKDHLGGMNKIFNGELIYPRQIEIHLPGDHHRACNFKCFFCQGRLLNQPLDRWEMKALNLMDKLKGKIPYYIFGGAYTEPTLNPYFMAFLSKTKDVGASFGIHTNGSMLKTLEENMGFLTELNALSTSKKDYLSISLDGGTPESHSKVKGVKEDYFTDIIKAAEIAVKAKGPLSVRLCYLMSDLNNSEEEIKGIIKIAKDIGVDSLRFSIPYALYGQDFKIVEKYKEVIEDKKDTKYEKLLKPLMSKDSNEKPHIFYLPPSFQSVKKMNFKQCIYSYYQITLASDGYVYKCSCTASSSFKGHRLGKITDDLEKFNEMVMANHNKDWDAQKNCWDCKARCNRMALELNSYWRDYEDSSSG